jgi:hypothetical protein
VTSAPFLETGAPAGIGSLPFDDVTDAARVELSLHPELPSAPQLPRRSPHEGMLAQVVRGMTGVCVADDDVDGPSLRLDRRSFGPGDVDAPLDPDAFGGTLGFLSTAASIGHRGAVKVQLAGPVTLGLALAAAGAKPAKAFSVAAAVVGGRARALVGAVRSALPASPVLFVVDEPRLQSYLEPGFPLGAEDTIDLLSGAMATATSSAADVISGVHCCGPTDWRLVLHAGPDLVSLPVEACAGDDAAGLSTFLDRGGWIAWGAVPTDRPIGDRDDALWRRLNGLWGELARNGCDPVRLRTQSVITPSCGLGRFGVEQVAPVYALVRRLAERVQDQAIAARMSAGA